MFRIKLISAIAVLLLFAFALAAALIWGANRAGYQMERSHLAHQTLESYLQFSVDTYRHFKERLDIVLLEAKPDNPNVVKSRKQLAFALQRIESYIQHEVRHVENTSEYDDELEELVRLKRLATAIEEILNTFDVIERLQTEGHQQEAFQLTKKLMERTLDERLSPLVREAVADEQGEVTHARENTSALILQLYHISAGLMLLALFFGVSVGFILWRNIKGPIDALVNGTKTLTSGDLSHRIKVQGNDEFTSVAKNFNTMAGELQRNESQLKDAQNFLEQKVEKRTHELAQANQTLQHMDDVRRQFFADVSHELRTPLTIIRGEAEVTLRGNDKTAQEYQTTLHRIVGLSEQLTKLVSDLLFLARSETLSARLDLSTTCLNDLVYEAWEDANMLARSKHQKFELEIEPNQLLVQGDQMRLKQLLHILIDNACKYSNEHATMKIVLEKTNDFILIHVKDEGIGISKEDQTIIFDRFYRSEKAAQTSQGSGLGLPMARSIVEMHKGKITLSSIVGKGTTFTVHLPFL